jgi:hypothetical protein
MRRKISDDLPRYMRGSDSDSRPQPFQWRRRYLLYVVAGLLIIYWLLPSKHTPIENDQVNWHRYAYSLYATDSATLCHAVLIFDALARFGSKADRVLFYPQNWDTHVENSRDRDSQLLVLARDTYGVKLQPVKLLTVEGRTTGGSALRSLASTCGRR